ncbi:MAG: TonB family protein [Rhodanobacteraceae bacterium]
MSDLLLRMLCGVTLGLVLTLLLRRPARRMFGSAPAFTLWLLPVALVMLPGMTVAPHVVAGAHAVATGWANWMLAVWLVGAALMLARLAVVYAHLLRGARAVPVCWIPALDAAMPRAGMRRVRVYAAGPALLWALPRALILLPEDFLRRFGDAPTRELVLRHELTHARRGDAWWNLAMEIVCALLWFHPLAWWARPRFRLDQELACDATALRTAPARAASYARALLDSVAVPPGPALIPWLSEPQLKERIAMIGRIPPRALRRRAGFAAIALLLAAGLYLAGGQLPTEAATHAASSSALPSVDVSYKNHNPPRYPENAINNGEQGTVMLRIHVNPDGSVAKVDVDHAGTTASSAELQAVAVTAAENWKFNPGSKDGKPVGGWITVPVGFSLNPGGSSANPCPAGEAYATTTSTCVSTAPHFVPPASTR